MSDTRPEGFLRRWSSRKTDVRQGKTPPPEPARDALPAEQPGATADRADGVRSAAPEHPPPTLDDVGQLTTSSDYSAFVRHEVPADVKNAAMKKLFANPHFNVMDGLDVYIDDYSQPDPLPLSTLRQMASAKFMNLVDDTEDPQPDETPQPAAPQGSPESVAQFESHRPPSEALDHDHADLRLQPDPAARLQDTGPEPG
ncbi:MAG: DUF3306 domain-containing protein [Betaproteobacteria bacterium]|nr:DUF3306 domain-containing protein [Betaproteobacteria bacterium]